LDRDFTAPCPNRVWVADFERHEAFLDQVVMKGHCWMPVAAGI
jgi:transposase InsO family protein